MWGTVLSVMAKIVEVISAGELIAKIVQKTKKFFKKPKRKRKKIAKKKTTKAKSSRNKGSR